MVGYLWVDIYSSQLVGYLWVDIYSSQMAGYLWVGIYSSQMVGYLWLSIYSSQPVVIGSHVLWAMCASLCHYMTKAGTGLSLRSVSISWK